MGIDSDNTKRQCHINSPDPLCLKKEDTRYLKESKEVYMRGSGIRRKGREN